MKGEDRFLIQQIRNGDAKARRRLYDRHESYWFRLCLRYANNRSEAQDIFQEGVVKVFRVLDKYRLDSNAFKSWSNKVIINEALKYLKRHQWQQVFEQTEDGNERYSENENALDKMSAKELIQLIQQLPTGYRVVFNLHEIEGYTHAEIAALLGIAAGTSKSQLSKAKKMLRQQLELLFDK